MLTALELKTLIKSLNAWHAIRRQFKIIVSSQKMLEKQLKLI